MIIKTKTRFSQDLYQVLGVAFVPAVKKRSFTKKFLHGDVLMEYVILLVCIVLVLVASQSAFSPTGNANAGALFSPAGEISGQFGLVGNAFHSSYTNIVLAASQPTP